MKLEPGRTSLSGRPEFLRPQPTPIVPPKPQPKQCCACGKPDAIIGIADPTPGYPDGEPVHAVTVELRFIAAANEAVARQKVTPDLQSKGWRYEFHLGRHAMRRHICRPCLEAFRELSREFARKKSNELRASMQESTYYSVLCGE